MASILFPLDVILLHLVQVPPPPPPLSHNFPIPICTPRRTVRVNCLTQVHHTTIVARD